MSYDDSKCRKNVYCDFLLSRDLLDALIEVCVNCGKRVVYFKKSRGRINNQKYLRDHIRHTVQPFGKTSKLFMQIYGDRALRSFWERARGKKTKREIRAEWDTMRKEIVEKSRKNTIYT